MENSMLRNFDPQPAPSNLNKSVYFNISLKERAFQPMHIETCKNRSFVILGNFRNKADTIVFHLFNTHMPEDGEDNLIYIKITKVEEVKCDPPIPNLICLQVSLDTTIKDPTEDLYNFPLNELELEKNFIIDLKLETQKGTKFKCDNNSKGQANIGNHICKSQIIEE